MIYSTMEGADDKVRRGGVSAWWAAGAAAATSLLLLAAALAERRLPAPRAGPPHTFNAYRAHAHLVNLTAIGPRVAGSYENEVLAVQWAVEALRQIAAEASPHNRLEIDVHTASGAFPLSFFDGMNNVYHDVQSVVARARGAGEGARPGRTALLLNCHLDTVPGSPGGSDDGAGCAVALETLRALVAAPRPLRHHVVCLLNGAEENILQASHAFVTTHKWARDLRVFVNIEACGAGGREVLFQAGPHDPWMLEVYAGNVPHPFASSLAQELFQSGLIPADTDFRIFRDFGRLSGVDLAWNSNGYVYHTRLDTAERVPLGALQRTGDNVLALLQGLLASPQLERETERSAGAPVFFDVLGVVLVAARPVAALLAAALAEALLLLRLLLSARDARTHLYLGRGEWARAVAGAAGAQAAGLAAGLASSAALAALLHAHGTRLAFYSRPWLLGPLYALPAVCGCWWGSRAAWRRCVGARGSALRGWWRARACGDAACAWAGVALAVCVARGLRSGFVPLLWVACGAAADVAAGVVGAAGGRRALLWALGAALPAAHTAYLALASLNMFVPITGRAGTPPLPSDVMMAVMVALLTLTTLSWMLPVVVAADNVNKLVGALACVAAAGVVLAACGGAPYSAERPQRVLLFHTRRTDHTNHTGPRRDAAVDNFFWIPEIDANTPQSLAGYVEGIEVARASGEEECARWLYCGAPYYLPVRRLIARGHSLHAREPPLPRLAAALRLQPLNASARVLHLDIEGPQHVVVVISPVEGARVSWSSVLDRLLEGPRWGRRRTYFLTLHHARTTGTSRTARTRLQLHVQHNLKRDPEKWADVSIAGHSLFGEDSISPAHRELLERLPPWTAAFGWGVDLHLYSV